MSDPQIKEGGAAFPRSGFYAADGPTLADNEPQDGMSLRDYFAAHAVIALGAHKAVVGRGIPWLAEHAYMLADAMLKAREGKS